MITDLCDRPVPARASARSRSASSRLAPPIARPPTFRNDRRETPSQYRCRGPKSVSMAYSPPSHRFAFSASLRATTAEPPHWEFVKQQYNRRVEPFKGV